MQKGTVKMWNRQRGFGFIKNEEGDDLFVNASDVHPALTGRGLQEGDRVKFDVRSDMKGDKAVNVRLDQ